MRLPPTDDCIQQSFVSLKYFTRLVEMVKEKKRDRGRGGGEKGGRGAVIDEQGKEKRRKRTEKRGMNL